MATATTQAPTRTRKAVKVVLDAVRELVAVRSEITALDKRKDALVAMLEGEFGVDKEAKTSEFDTLVRNNIDLARVEWRNRGGFSEKQFIAELAIANPELAELVKPYIELGRTNTKYSAIVTLYK